MTARQVVLILVTAAGLFAAQAAQATPKIRHKPLEAEKGKDLAIKAIIQADGEVVQPYVAYRSSASGDFTQVPLKHDAGKDYSGVIPGSALKGSVFKYYIGALDGSDLSEATWKSKAKPERVQFAGAAEEKTEKTEKPPPAAEKPAESKPSETKTAESKSSEKPDAEASTDKRKASESEKPEPAKEEKNTDEKPAPEAAADQPAKEPAPAAAAPPPPARADRAATGVEVVRQFQAPAEPAPLPRYQAEFRGHVIYDLFLSVAGLYLRTPGFQASGIGGGFDGSIGYATEPNFAPSIKGGGIILPEASQYYILAGVMMPQWSCGVFVGAVNLGPIDAPRQWGAQADIPIVYAIQPLFKLTVDFGAGFIPSQNTLEATVRVGVGI